MNEPETEVDRYLAAGLPGEPLEERRVFAELHDALFGGESAPITLSRYVVLHRIAEGGLGVVYAGYDPQLDRKVAIKLLQSRPVGAPIAETHARLLREARVLARLTHPNVVAVHDVGTYDEHDVSTLMAEPNRSARGVFVVMELVAGVDLGRWLAAQTRGWREVLDVFIQAGRGLAAAHAAGVVHRDFKPANVIVGDDGRARVLDFGLARALAPDTPPSSPAVRTVPAIATEPIAVGRVALTQSGAVLGTPAYMAPEQHAARHSDERTDEFAFFAALYEGVYGALPYRSAEIGRLAADKAASRIAVPPRGRTCPARLHRAIVRGLSAEPSERFATMADALLALQRVKQGWRRRAPWLVAGGASVIAAVAVATAEREPCAGQAAQLEGVWDPEVKAAIRVGLDATGLPFAAATLGSVERTLDAYADQLVQVRTDACYAARALDADPNVALRTNLCLDRRLSRFRELTRLLREPDHGLAERAVEATASLPSVSSCASVDVQRSMDAAGGDAVRGIDEALARAEALRDAGRFQAGLVHAQRAVEAASRFGEAGSASRSLRIAGLLQGDLGDTKAAEQSLDDALLEAERAGLTDAAAYAMVDLVGLIAQSHARFEEGDRLAELARARLQYRGLHDELDARLALEIGRLRHAQGRNDEAFAALREALALAIEVWGQGHPRVADVLNERGNSLDRQGRYAEAMTDYERALAIRRELLGAEHPRVGASLNNIANIQSSLGRQQEALQTYARALAIYQNALGPEHPRCAAVINNIAVVHEKLGRSQDALREHRRALSIRERTLPADHPLLALDHNNIGTALAKLGQKEEALAEYQQALDSRVRRLGEDHPDVAHTLDNIAVTLGQLGRVDEAIVAARRALAIRETALGPDHPDVATSRRHLEGLERPRPSGE